MIKVEMKYNNKFIYNKIYHKIKNNNNLIKIKIKLIIQKIQCNFKKIKKKLIVITFRYKFKTINLNKFKYKMTTKNNNIIYNNKISQIYLQKKLTKT